MNVLFLFRNLKAIAAIATLAIGMSACAALPGSGSSSWKEQVLLHDGQKIIVERSQSYGGRSEPGQSSPVKEHRVRFKLPGSTSTITWTSEYGDDLGRTNFNLLALHIRDAVPYLVVEPNLCLSYNKSGRPNPPYVFFKYEAKEWRRIALEALPAEFKTLNVVINNSRQTDIEELQKGAGYVPAEDVQAINRSLRQPEYRSILREPLERDKCPQYSSGPRAPNPITPSTK